MAKRKLTEEQRLRRNERQRAHYQENLEQQREIKRARRAAWRAAHPEQERQNKQVYRSAHLDKVRERDRRAKKTWRQEHPEEWKRISQARNTEEKRAKWRAWRAEHHMEQHIRETEKSRAYRAAHPAEAALCNMVWSAAMRARKTGMEFDGLVGLAESAPAECACCGVRFEFTMPRVGHGRKGLKRNLKAPTLDRIDNAQGYVKENVAVICCGCNIRKGNATLEQLRMLISYMETARPSES